MKSLKLENDILVYYKQANSFPDGVLEAHQYLHSLVDYSVEREYYGISWMGQQGEILYKAAAKEWRDGEFSAHGLPEFIIKSGTYIYEDVRDFMQHVDKIGTTFQGLLEYEKIDPQGACVEWYLNDQICRCMIRVID